MKNTIKKSPWISIFNCSSCNGCDLECLALLTPKYDIERFGMVWKTSPRHADVLVVTGIGNKTAAKRLKTIYDQMAPVKKVVAIGSCANTGGVFRTSYNMGKKIDEIIKVDIYVPGCPPRPEAIINGIAKAIGLLGNNTKIKNKLKNNQN
tara:strand:- start:4540 stop:4989 length:450 start_codon:yes stop_codon:yes gene_type:complete